VVAARRREFAGAHPRELHRRRHHRRCTSLISCFRPPRCNGWIVRSCRGIFRTPLPSSRVRCGTFRSATARDFF
jgi:hypothetical protein